MSFCVGRKNHRRKISWLLRREKQLCMNTTSDTWSLQTRLFSETWSLQTRLCNILKCECIYNPAWVTLDTTRQHRAPATPQKFFTRNPTICFPEVDKTSLYVFGRLPGIVGNLLESGNLFCSATGTTQTALDVLQLCFNYIALSFLTNLAYTFPGRLDKEIHR